MKLIDKSFNLHVYVLYLITTIDCDGSTFVSMLISMLQVINVTVPGLEGLEVGKNCEMCVMLIMFYLSDVNPFYLSCVHRFYLSKLIKYPPAPPT
jgi:hypothetical protein